jgi:ferric-dicitrate binding protein FerR (iron transport regulator)
MSAAYLPSVQPNTPSNSLEPSMPKRNIETKAAAWIYELETADSFESIWPRFQAWLNEDPQHGAIYRRIEKAWRLARQVLETCSSPDCDIRRH